MPYKKRKKVKRYGINVSTNRYECFYCGDELTDYTRTKDHLIPKSRNGILSNDNKVWSCRECNSLKADMTPEEFYKAMKFLVSQVRSNYYETMDAYMNICRRLDVMIKYKESK